MICNYRVVKRKELEGNEMIDVYGIHECYYNDCGIESGITVDPVRIDWSESIDDLDEKLELMKKALEKPVLNYDDF